MPGPSGRGEVINIFACTTILYQKSKLLFIYQNIHETCNWKTLYYSQDYTINKGSHNILRHNITFKADKKLSVISSNCNEVRIEMSNSR